MWQRMPTYCSMFVTYLKLIANLFSVHRRTWWFFIRRYTLVLNVPSCIDVYSYSCLHPLSNERKSMFKLGDSSAVWTWVCTWKYLDWALHYLHDVIYGKRCGPDWPFRRVFLFAKTLRTVMSLWRRYNIRKYTADAILFREIQCKKMNIF